MDTFSLPFSYFPIFLLLDPPSFSVFLSLPFLRSSLLPSFSSLFPPLLYRAYSSSSAMEGRVLLTSYLDLCRSLSASREAQGLLDPKDPQEIM